MNHATQPLCSSSDPLTSFEAADAAKQLIQSHERLIVAALESNQRVRLTGQVVKSASGRNQREWTAT